MECKPGMDSTKFKEPEPAQSRCCCTSTTSIVVLIVCAVLAVVSGALFLALIYDLIITAVVNDMMTLTPSSLLYPEWATPAIPLTSSFYIFEIMNPDDVYNGAKPILEERGPYVYSLYVERQNITFNGNGTISSIPVYTYVFDRKKSTGPDTDRYLCLNMPMTSTAYMMRDSPRLIRRSMSRVLDQLDETMFVELSVAEILWGYDEPLFEFISDFFPIPGMTDQFGFLLGYNGTQINGIFTVYDGVKDKSILNQIDRWKGQSELDFWFTPEANMLNGTDGMMWSPFMDDVDELDLFHQDFCRTMPYVYTEDETFKGIQLKRFHLAPFAYDNGTMRPLNAGFCEGDLCAPMGIQRMDPCRFNSPMGLSNPHFLESDPWLTDQVIGLNPDQEKHRNYFLLDPLMGMPFVMKQRLQISMYIEKVDDISQMGNVRTMYTPVLWFEQEVDVPDDIIDMYKLGFQTSELIVNIMAYTMIVIGILIFIPASIVLINRCSSKSAINGENEPLLLSMKSKVFSKSSKR